MYNFTNVLLTEKKCKTNNNQTCMLKVGFCSFYLLYFSLQGVCPFLIMIMCIASIHAMIRLAVRKDFNPSIGRICFFYKAKIQLYNIVEIFQLPWLAAFRHLLLTLGQPQGKAGFLSTGIARGLETCEKAKAFLKKRLAACLFLYLDKNQSCLLPNQRHDTNTSIHPLTFHLHVGFIHSPRIVRCVKMGPYSLIQFCPILMNPTHNSGVSH